MWAGLACVFCSSQLRLETLVAHGRGMQLVPLHACATNLKRRYNAIVLHSLGVQVETYAGTIKPKAM